MSDATPAMAVHLTWPDAVVCRVAAARFHGLPVAPTELVDAWVPDNRRPLLNFGAHQFQLADTDVVQLGRYRVTTAERSVIDTLANLPMDEARALLVWVITRRRVSRGMIEQHLGAHPRRWGNTQLQRLLKESAGGALSPAERKLHTILRHARITRWEANAVVRDHQGIIGTVDVLIEHARLVIEVDGRAAHGREQFQKERTRQNRLMAAGYRVLRFTWEDVAHRADGVAAQVRAMLR